jgi:uncharacterized delta-60 repeat protein
MLGRTAVAASTVVQPDGRILVGGTAVARRRRPTRFALVRYSDRGRPDPSFARFPAVRGPAGRLSALALEPDGTIVAVGRGGDDFVTARYLPDGRLDPAFGGGAGFVRTDLGADDEAVAVGVDSSGRIVAAGDSIQFLPDGTDASKLVAVRYTPDGSLDPSYGSGGRAAVGFTDDAFANAARFAPDGAVTVGGVHYVGIDQTDAGIALARFTPGGVPDSAFGTGGANITPFPPDSFGLSDRILRGLGFLPDGRAVALGEGSVRTKDRIVMERLLPDGGLDPSFGSGGAAVFGVTDGLTYTAAPDATGAAFAVGPSFGPLRGTTGHAQGIRVTKYSSTGGFDRAFGRHGRSDISFDDAEAADVSVDARGRILIVGSVNKNARHRFLLLRLRPGGKPDRSFGSRHR